MTDDQKKLLLETCDWIEANVPPEHFDLMSWIFSTDPNNAEPRPPGPHCGTTGCFMGWATFAPACRAAGLYLDGDMPTIIGRYACGFGAAMFLFGLSRRDANYLFHVDGYAGRRPPLSEVLDRVRDYANRQESSAAACPEKPGEIPG